MSNKDKSNVCSVIIFVVIPFFIFLTRCVKCFRQVSHYIPNCLLISSRIPRGVRTRVSTAIVWIGKSQMQLWDLNPLLIRGINREHGVKTDGLVSALNAVAQTYC